MPEYKFIPRSEMEVKKPRSSYNGLIITVSFIIFLTSLAAYGAAFIYKWYLDRQINVYNSTFEKIRSEIEIKSIVDVLNKSREIETAKALLSKHIAPSRVFGFLEEDTIKSNYYTSFSFGEGSGEDKQKIKLDGVTKNYKELAKQIEAVKDSKNFEEPEFSGFKLLDNGDISYVLNLKVKGQVLNY